MEECRRLIARAMKRRKSEDEGCLQECITILTTAISRLERTQESIQNGDKEEELCHLLAKALCLRALCTQDEDGSKFKFEEIDRALKLWLSVPATKMVEDNSYTLLYHVADLLLLKGHMDLHCKLYKLMIKYCEHKNVSLETGFLARLLATNSISHAMCTSHMDNVLISTVSEHFPSSRNVEFWRSLMKNSELELSFEQWFSVPDVSPITNIQKNKDLDPYLHSNLYYESSKQLLLKGEVIEALFNAQKAYATRLYNFFGSMIFSFVPCTIIQKADTAATAWPGIDIHSQELSYITPWNIVRALLESALQVGTLLEIVGEEGAARHHLEFGKAISDLQDLPIFSINFSIVLAKIYTKKQCQQEAKRELEAANDLLDNRSSVISCSKCKKILKARVTQLYGNLCTSEPGSAIHFYAAAVTLLKDAEWKNCVSSPRRAVLKRTGCRDGSNRISVNHSCPCAPTCVSDDANCWHCVPLGVKESSSMKSLIDLKWECARRRLLVKLYIDIGESSLANGKPLDAHAQILCGKSVLVKRDTFKSKESTISFTELIKRGKTGGTFAVEHTSLIYAICSLSLRSNDQGKQNCHEFNLPIPEVVYGLKVSLIGCQEVPELYKKVTSLLAALYVNHTFFSIPDSDSLSASHWGAFCHQASVGANFTCCVFSRNLAMDVVGPSPSSSSKLWSHRMHCDAVDGLQEFILNFYKGLPPATIVCISILDEDYARLLHGVISPDAKSYSNQWIMISRLNSDRAPDISMWPLKQGKELHNAASQLRVILDDYEAIPNGVPLSVVKSVLFDLDDRVGDFLRDTGDLLFDAENRRDLLLGESINDGRYRKPVILVLDDELHVLPWESFPMYSGQEVYRMPSVASIMYTLERQVKREKGGEGCSPFPMIDPHNAFYMVDPDGTLKCKADFLTEQLKKGTIGCLPDGGEDELLDMLKEHHLYIYIGHGSGKNHISKKALECLERCAAVMLTGCESGCLNLKGPYIPSGTVLSYLLAGSPVVIGCLWKLDIKDGLLVTEKMLELCTQARNSKCNDKTSIGSCLANAREGCRFPKLFGTSFVCYGVPTYISRDRD